MPRTTKEILATLDLTGNRWLRERVLAALDEAHAAGAASRDGFGEPEKEKCGGICFYEQKYNGLTCSFWETHETGCGTCPVYEALLMSPCL